MSRLQNVTKRFFQHETTFNKHKQGNTRGVVVWERVPTPVGNSNSIRLYISISTCCAWSSINE